MKLTILGCSGGIGSGRQTTGFLLDHDILIDAGTGITTLELEQLLQIDHVFLTHSHMDHILGLPLLLDVVGHQRNTPLIVHALPATLEILEKHIFNWRIWPDFREIPDKLHPWLKFSPLPLGSSITLDGRTLSALPAHHTVPACGYRISGKSGSLVFTGDTSHSDALIHALNEIDDLGDLIIETSFENAMHDIAVASMHHDPNSLAHELAHLKSSPRIWISHLKPGNEDAILSEIRQVMPGREISPLSSGLVIEW